MGISQMFKKSLIAAMIGSLAFSIAGCPPQGNNNGNSTTQNENTGGETNENTGTSANENENGGASANENANSAVNQNANGAAANENVNGSTNANDNASANDNGSGTGSILGRFAGNLTGTSAQSLNGAQSGSFARNYAASLQFEGAFAPLVIPIPNYGLTSVQDLTNVQVGQTQTFNYSDSIGPLVLVATVREATYQASQAHVVVDLTYTGTSASLSRNGTGVHTFDAIANAAGTLSVTINTSYAVRQSNASLTFDTTDVIAVTGELPKQP